MNLNGLFTQIVVAAVAVGIVFTYVRPTLGAIGDLQTSIASYREEIRKVDAVNAQLADLVAAADQLSASDRRALRTYLPDAVDVVAVPRDLDAMAEQAGVLFQSVSYNQTLNDFFLTERGRADTDRPTPHVFQVQIEGTYEQIKQFLELTERNHYPLQVSSLSIDRGEDELVRANVELVTFVFKPETDTSTNPN